MFHGATHCYRVTRCYIVVHRVSWCYTVLQGGIRGAYHLTEKSGWGGESIMVSNLPVYRRNATSVTV